MAVPTRPPTADELLADPAVLRELADAWLDSLPGNPLRRHEEGGWIYVDTSTGQVTTRRAPSGLTAQIDLGGPPLVPGSVVVGTFHTHPNPSSQGWRPGPSGTDRANAALTGVPWLIRSEA